MGWWGSPIFLRPLFLGFWQSTTLGRHTHVCAGQSSLQQFRLSTILQSSVTVKHCTALYCTQLHCTAIYSNTLHALYCSNSGIPIAAGVFADFPAAGCWGLQHTAHCTFYTAQSTLHTAHCMLYSTHSKLKAARCTLYSTYSTQHDTHCILHTQHCRLHITHCTL